MFLQTLARDFFDGGSAYNASSLVVGFVGFLITGIGLVIGLWQLKKTRSAAESAETAAKATSAEFTKVAALIEVGELLHFAREVIAHINSNENKLAAIRSLDLRIAVSRFRYTDQGKKTLTEPEWQTVVTRVSLVHNALENFGKRGTLAAEDADIGDCRKTMSLLCEQFGKLSTGIATGGR